MVSGKNKKRGKSVNKKIKPDSSDGNLSRLDLLKKKLELEQEMIEEGKVPSGKEIERLDKELETKDETEDKSDEDKAEDDDDDEEITDARGDSAKAAKVEDIIRHSREKAASQEASKLSFANIKNFAKRIKEYQNLFDEVRKEVAKIVVGQRAAVDGMLRALVADGHVLVEGVPGVAKTTLIRTLAQTTACSFSRIQFTPDLLPTDIIGISTYQEGRGFYTLKGPIFSNFILADEINRAPPKVQSALLECMAEKQATIAKESFPVPLPFFTMATQNPVENVGTYSLPEAQVDRFLFKIYMGYPSIDEEERVLNSNITSKTFDSYQIRGILNPDIILGIQADAKLIYVDKKVQRYIVKIIDATRFPKKYGISLGKYIEYGSSPRGAIGLFNGARADALLNGQNYSTPHNVKKIAYDVIRHRLLLSYEGQAEGIKTDDIITEVLKKVPVP